eukprot:TRINITY_DN12849_c0_g1_i1.p1 TRINITY_DN12849_c0_g1~~TRINITY_DN12849_c0_g1_i1.p1  ORF type:complete len:256 (+),score=46.15 TRINITY_DN12849_c0_g1_i1:86-853(+)
MSSIGTGYDLSATTYSPDGRVFQIEYAGKAVDNSGTAIALRCKDGVVLGVEKLVLSRMLEPGSNRRIFSIDRHIGAAIAGLHADGRLVINKARSEARAYKNTYGHPIPVKVLNDRLSQFVQMNTLYGSTRPYGVGIFLAGMDAGTPQLYYVEPSGVSWGYFGAAMGKAKQQAKSEIEKLNLKEMSCRQAIFEVSKIIHQVHDEVKDRDFEFELSWVCEESGNEHQFVPDQLRQDTVKQAKAQLKAERGDVDSDDE